MANYPQLDNARGVWNMKEVYDAVMGGYWPNTLSRGVFGGGQSPIINVTDYVTLSTAGDATDFGDLTIAKSAAGEAGSFTRCLFAGGETPTIQAGIDYVTTMSTGNAADFGDITDSRRKMGATSNAIRAIFAGGLDPTVKNVIDYVTMASTGNAIDFGDL